MPDVIEMLTARRKRGNGGGKRGGGNPSSVAGQWKMMLNSGHSRPLCTSDNKFNDGGIAIIDEKERLLG
jgi:hypothetical protein